MRTLLGANCVSDHFLVRRKYLYQIDKNYHSHWSWTPNINVEKLKEPKLIKVAYMSTINAYFDALPHSGLEDSSDEMCRKIRDYIQSVARNTIGHVERDNRNE